MLDPQKYADAAIHDRYLAPSADHQDVMIVVLNHIDTVPEERRESMLADVRRLLDADGLDRVPVLPVSARLGIGIDELRAEIARRAAEKQSTRVRIDADVRAAAARLAEATGDAPTRVLPDERAAALDDAFAEAAGVPVLVDAVERSTRQRVGRATGWPIAVWLGGLKPDPVKRLDLDLGADGRELTGRGRGPAHEAAQVQRARVDTEVRALADDVSHGMTPPWVDAVHRASVARLDDLGDRLDAALAAAEIGAARIPVWAGLVRVLQWLLLGAAVAGLVWTGRAARVRQALRPRHPPGRRRRPGPGAARRRARAGHRDRAGVPPRRSPAPPAGAPSSADQRLRAAVSEVSRELVVVPVEAELAAYTAVRAGVDRARA